ncbi:MAG: hypothetical protein E7284_10225 [Lachnospiraceae bacterium]|nr:hypothetical protein [Lachnospiraceae bacterium]
MKKKEEVEQTAKVQENKRYRGYQLLKMEKYQTRVAKVVLKSDRLYSFEEADKLISDFMKKKG